MEPNYAGGEGAIPKKKRNTNYCSAPQCSQYAETGVSLHLFPKNPKTRSQWEAALKMGKSASVSMRICSHHFLPSDYFPATANAVRHKLRPDAVPSQNLPVRTHDTPESSTKKEERLARSRRAEERKSREKSKDQTSTTPGDEPPVANNDANLGGENVNESAGSDLASILSVAVQVNLADCRTSRPKDSDGLANHLCDGTTSEKCTQVNFLPKWTVEVPESVKPFTLSDLLNNKLNLFTFTGIHSMDLLNTLVSCVEEIAVEATTNKKVLSVRDRVILTMVKIKENMTFEALGVLFGVTGQTCGNYFRNMCPMLAEVCKVMIPFPDQELIRSNLPKSFKNYKHTRIILDCAETPIEKCKCLKCRILTYSQYKKTYTVKFNVGVTPSGLITEISVPYGGRASDKYIVNDSGILLKMDFRDGVMADKGYRIEKECQEHYLDLIRPPFLKKKQQMSRDDAIKNAEIARARVHVERVIQRIRQYELLQGTIPWTLAPYVEDVLIIVAALTNMGPPVINIDKFM